MSTIFPVYIFKGSETYLKKEALDNLKKALLGKGSEAFNFNVYELGKCDLQEALNTVRSAPFISGKRLVVFRDAALISEKEKNMIVEYARHPSKHSCLVIDISKEEMRRGFYGDIRQYAKEISFAPLSGNRLLSWVRDESKQRGKSMGCDAAAILCEIRQNDTEGLINEIDKLVSYVGKRALISKEDVEAITGGSGSRGVFEMTDALSRKDAKEALIIADKLLKDKKTVPEILGLIGWQIRKIKRAKGGRVFTAKETNKILERLLEADQGIKTGHIKPRAALEALIIIICAGEGYPI